MYVASMGASKELVHGTFCLPKWLRLLLFPRVGIFHEGVIIEFPPNYYKFTLHSIAYASSLWIGFIIAHVLFFLGVENAARNTVFIFMLFMFTPYCMLLIAFKLRDKYKQRGYRGVYVYFDSKKRLIGVPSGEWRDGTKGLDIYLVLEPGYDDDALEEFIIKVLSMCYAKKATDNGDAIIKYTGKKNYNSAVKGFKSLVFSWERNVGYSFVPSVVCKEYKGSFVHLWDERITAPLNYEKGTLAQAFRKAMEISSQDDYQPVAVAPITQSITLLCEKEVSYIEPQDEHFINAEDYNVAEIYQGYSYSKGDSKDPVAELFLSMASELYCDISPDNIRGKWEHLYGKAEEFHVMDADILIFTHRVEFKNKITHKISYLIQLSEYELFACELEIRLKGVNKALHFELIKLFGVFARSISLN